MRILTVVLVAALPCLAVSAEHPVHDGKWEVTSSTAIPGMMTMPPQTHTQCITKNDPVPKHESPRAKNCKVTEKKITGATVTWKVQCEGQHGPTEGTGSITYAHDSFEGSMTFMMTDPRGGGSMEVTTSMKGQRVGECDQ